MIKKMIKLSKKIKKNSLKTHICSGEIFSMFGFILSTKTLFSTFLSLHKVLQSLKGS